MGSPKNFIKAEIMPLVFSLLTNKTIKVLDIRGNGIGNPLGLGLGKVLQANTSLEELYIDENSITLPGFQNIKIGLERNKTLLFFPTPLQDINAALKDNKAILDVINSIQQVCPFLCFFHEHHTESVR